MPAEPQTVAFHLGRLAADGRAMARAAISHAHAVAETVKGWRNQAPAAKQASALTSEALARIRETARLPRRGRGGRMETPAADGVMLDPYRMLRIAPWVIGVRPWCRFTAQMHPGYIIRLSWSKLHFHNPETQGVAQCTVESSFALVERAGSHPPELATFTAAGGG